jgi:hypothetical protein
MRVSKTPSRPEPSAKNELGEYATFENALKTILSVPHSKIKSKLNAEKRKRIKKSSASREANGRD